MAHWKLASKYADRISSPLDNLKKNLNKATGVLLLDGTFFNVKGESECVHIAYDTGIGVVDYFIDITENKTAYGYVFRRLKNIGYQPICIVSDGHGSIASLVNEENMPHQRCIFHILQDMKNKLGIHGELRGGDHVLYSRLKYILKSETIEQLAERIDFFKEFSRPNFHTAKQKRVISWFCNLLPDASLHLSFKSGEIPRTNNFLENLNGQIEARIKTFRGIKSEESLHKLLKILFRFRNYK